MKRVFDVIFSFIAIILLLPLVIPIITVLKFSGEGEVWYLQERIGKDGNIFYLMKFVTMLKDSPNLGTGEITLHDDPRVLPFGKFLRKTKLNEIPQLVNVFKGDMSFVGPRPQTKKCFDYYTHDTQKKIISVKPGITGLGSVVFRDEESLLKNADSHEIMYQKIMTYKGDIELWYIDNLSFINDFKILFLTIWVIFFVNSELVFKIFPLIPRLQFNKKIT